MMSSSSSPPSSWRPSPRRLALLLLALTTAVVSAASTPITFEKPSPSTQQQLYTALRTAGIGQDKIARWLRMSRPREGFTTTGNVRNQHDYLHPAPRRHAVLIFVVDDLTSAAGLDVLAGVQWGATLLRQRWADIASGAAMSTTTTSSQSSGGSAFPPSAVGSEYDRFAQRTARISRWLQEQSPRPTAGANATTVQLTSLLNLTIIPIDDRGDEEQGALEVARRHSEITATVDAVSSCIVTSRYWLRTATSPLVAAARSTASFIVLPSSWDDVDLARIATAISGSLVAVPAVVNASQGSPRATKATTAVARAAWGAALRTVNATASFAAALRPSVSLLGGPSIEAAAMLDFAVSSLRSPVRRVSSVLCLFVADDLAVGPSNASTQYESANAACALAKRRWMIAAGGKTAALLPLTVPVGSFDTVASSMSALESTLAAWRPKLASPPAVSGSTESSVALLVTCGSAAGLLSVATAVASLSTTAAPYHPLFGAMLLAPSGPTTYLLSQIHRQSLLSSPTSTTVISPAVASVLRDTFTTLWPQTVETQSAKVESRSRPLLDARRAAPGIFVAPSNEAYAKLNGLSRQRPADVGSDASIANIVPFAAESVRGERLAGIDAEAMTTTQVPARTPLVIYGVIAAQLAHEWAANVMATAIDTGGDTAQLAATASLAFDDLAARTLPLFASSARGLQLPAVSRVGQGGGADDAALYNLAGMSCPMLLPTVSTSSTVAQLAEVSSRVSFNDTLVFCYRDLFASPQVDVVRLASAGGSLVAVSAVTLMQRTVPLEATRWSLAAWADDAPSLAAQTELLKDHLSYAAQRLITPRGERVQLTENQTSSEGLTSALFLAPRPVDEPLDAVVIISRSAFDSGALSPESQALVDGLTLPDGSDVGESAKKWSARSMPPMGNNSVVATLRALALEQFNDESAPTRVIFLPLDAALQSSPPSVVASAGGAFSINSSSQGTAAFSSGGEDIYIILTDVTNEYVVDAAVPGVRTSIEAARLATASVAQTTALLDNPPLARHIHVAVEKLRGHIDSWRRPEHLLLATNVFIIADVIPVERYIDVAAKFFSEYGTALHFFKVATRSEEAASISAATLRAWLDERIEGLVVVSTVSELRDSSKVEQFYEEALLCLDADVCSLANVDDDSSGTLVVPATAWGRRLVTMLKPRPSRLIYVIDFVACTTPPVSTESLPAGHASQEVPAFLKQYTHSGERKPPAMRLSAVHPHSDCDLDAVVLYGFSRDTAGRLSQATVRLQDAKSAVAHRHGHTRYLLAQLALDDHTRRSNPGRLSFTGPARALFSTPQVPVMLQSCESGGRSVFYALKLPRIPVARNILSAGTIAETLDARWIQSADAPFNASVIESPEWHAADPWDESSEGVKGGVSALCVAPNAMVLVLPVAEPPESTSALPLSIAAAILSALLVVMIVVATRSASHANGNVAAGDASKPSDRAITASDDAHDQEELASRKRAIRSLFYVPDDAAENSTGNGYELGASVRGRPVTTSQEEPDSRRASSLGSRSVAASGESSRRRSHTAEPMPRLPIDNPVASVAGSGNAVVDVRQVMLAVAMVLLPVFCVAVVPGVVLGSALTDEVSHYRTLAAVERKSDVVRRALVPVESCVVAAAKSRKFLLQRTITRSGLAASGNVGSPLAVWLNYTTQIQVSSTVSTRAVKGTCEFAVELLGTAELRDLVSPSDALFLTNSIGADDSLAVQSLNPKSALVALVAQSYEVEALRNILAKQIFSPRRLAIAKTSILLTHYLGAVSAFAMWLQYFTDGIDLRQWNSTAVAPSVKALLPDGFTDGSLETTLPWTLAVEMLAWQGIVESSAGARWLPRDIARRGLDRLMLIARLLSDQVNDIRQANSQTLADDKRTISGLFFDNVDVRAAVHAGVAAFTTNSTATTFSASRVYILGDAIRYQQFVRSATMHRQHYAEPTSYETYYLVQMRTWVTTLAFSMLCIVLTAVCFVLSYHQLQRTYQSTLKRAEVLADVTGRFVPIRLISQCLGVQHISSTRSLGLAPPSMRQCTTLVSDIRDFNSLAMACEGRELEWLRSVIKPLVAVVRCYDGIVHELVGDAMMTFFDEPKSALHAAIMMLVEVAKMNLETEARVATKAPSQRRLAAAAEAAAHVVAVASSPQSPKNKAMASSPKSSASLRAATALAAERSTRENAMASGMERPVDDEDEEEPPALSASRNAAAGGEDALRDSMRSSPNRRRQSSSKALFPMNDFVTTLPTLLNIGVHHGTVTFGAIDINGRALIGPFCEAVRIARMLQRSCLFYGANLVVSQITLEEADCPTLHTRRLGCLISGDISSPIPIVDVFQREEARVKIYKKRTKVLFETAVDLIRDARFDDAVALLRQCQQVAAQHQLRDNAVESKLGALSTVDRI